MRAFEKHVPNRQPGHLLDQADAVLSGTNMPAPVMKQLKYVLIALAVFDGILNPVAHVYAPFCGLSAEALRVISAQIIPEII
jgi:hypothetical protein